MLLQGLNELEGLLDKLDELSDMLDELSGDEPSKEVLKDDLELSLWSRQQRTLLPRLRTTLSAWIRDFSSVF